MKKLQLATKILAVVLIAAIAFVGIYVQKQNRMENIVKDYDLGMDLKGARVLQLAVSDETEEITKDKNGNVIADEDKEENGDYTTETNPVNPDDVKTADNYNKSKSIIENRLKELGVSQYNIKVDENTGKIIIEIPENDQTDHIVSNISEVGKFEIVDSEDTSNVLMNNSDIKKANVMYNSTQKGTVVYLNIEFNKEGTEKLKNISTEYATVESNSSNTTATETTEESTEDTQKEITMQIDGTKMITTSFDETMEQGSIQLSMGQATTDKDKLNDNIESATTIATILDTGNLPIHYDVDENEFIASDITPNILFKIAIVAIAIAVIALLVLIIKYKKVGLLAAIAYIGFVAIYLLLIRYTNVIITLEGVSAIAVIFTLNYIFNFKLLSKIKEEDENTNAIKKAYKSFCIKAIPVAIFSVVFCFMSWTPISSFGMTMFWGLALMALYNITITKSFLK